MYDYVIIHGSYGSPFENWFPWLYDKLTQDGKNVLVPQFPCGLEDQNYKNWGRVMDAYKPLINDKTIFIGHSLAPAFIVDYLINNSLKVRKIVLVAPFYGLINISDFDAVNSPFFIKHDFSRIQYLVQERVCYISKTDPYVPNILSIDFATKINAKIVMFENAGHFNASAGFTSFEALYQELSN